MWSLGFAFILLYLNSRSVSNFGTFEYWFAMIKVTAIVLFIILGVVQIFGIGVPAVGFHNLTRAAGRIHAAWIRRRMDGGDHGRVLVQRHRSDRGDVGRGSKDPAKAIPAALRTMVLRLFLFYILALDDRRHHRSLDGDRREGRGAKSVRAGCSLSRALRTRRAS